MPATRATGMAMPVSSAPNSNCPTSDGTISNATPGRGFTDRSENKHPFHRVYFRSFRARIRFAMT